MFSQDIGRLYYISKHEFMYHQGSGPVHALTISRKTVFPKAVVHFQGFLIEKLTEAFHVLQFTDWFR